MVGFNVVVRGHGPSGSFVSLSPHVRTEEDLTDPSKWVRLVFAAYSFSTGTTNIEKIVSARYLARAPLISGSVEEKEWNKNTSFSVDIPLPPGYVYEAKFPVQKTTFTPYTYSYQADKRRSLPCRGVRDSAGNVSLADFPITNAGPWFSCDRVQWHRGELSEIVDAGLDVVLPVYQGDKASRAAFADKGLDCLVAALQELKAEGKPQPLVGMLMDTDSLKTIYGKSPDLKDEEVKRTFYGIIKDFFDRVPAEFRATAPTGKPNPGRQADIIFLRGQWWPDVKPDLVQYCSEQFEKDFGFSLVWVTAAANGITWNTGVCDGIASGTVGPILVSLPLSSLQGPNPRIEVSRVTAGYDDTCALPKSLGDIVPRMGGDTYSVCWSDALKRNAPWVLCDSWTDFAEGAELGASREYGRKYVEATCAAVKKFEGGKDFDARFLRYSVPSVIAPKQFAMAELVIKNTGKNPWAVADGFAIGYRWYRSGRFFGESKVKRPFDADVAPGETVTVDVGIATVTVQGSPIPDGDCYVRLLQPVPYCYSS